MPVYLLCSCLGEGGVLCLQFACKGCCGAAPAVAAQHFSAALRHFAVPGTSTSLFSRISFLIVTLKTRTGKRLCIFVYESETSNV